MSNNRKTELTVAYRSIPALEELDFAVVRTLDVHEMLILLGGSPLFTVGDYIENIYAEDVESSDDYSLWFVHFRKGMKFSDGSSLTAAHWYHSIARAIRVGAGVHFNPRKDILGADSAKDGYCEGLSLNGQVVRIELKEPNRNFSRLIGKVEASILPIHDASTNELELLRGPVSGPYMISSYEQKRVVLQLNKNFPGHKERAQFQTLVIRQMSDEAAFEARIRGEVDFISPLSVPQKTVRDQLLAVSQAHRDFAQTTFLSFRFFSGATESDRPWQHIAQCRRGLAEKLSDLPNVAGLEKTSTILMGAGLGRIAEEPPIAQVALGSMPRLTLAAVDRPHCRQIVEYLSNCGINLSVTWVKSFNELYSGEAAKTDALIGWNDFCAEDPYISFYNALNPDRPLFLDDGTMRARLAKIQMTTDRTMLDREYQELHKQLLESAAVIPIFGQWYESFAARELDLSKMRGGVLWTMGKKG